MRKTRRQFIQIGAFMTCVSFLGTPFYTYIKKQFEISAEISFIKTPMMHGNTLSTYISENGTMHYKSIYEL
ncbi:hypothetical protein BHU72_01500 [Desulfuribacillus stibiiarsenatis]|uniref:Uncharacterized protein n=1 Tax=Desulfuribacillus stibiiarsenatis TaxID=1390249 RepID=A0A1E5L9Z9_9FIRM|nr:hypothetical protein [Desulfuribacillus stibiiarsenatis]OEH86960.1 hypothetical protein BHU72_01500 [Desulfuribacillus stibiiarsenatis]